MNKTLKLRNASLLTALTLAGLAGPVDAAPLKSYNADPNAVTVSGISSGGYFAAQIHVAYSGTFKGAAVFAGGPYLCAEGSVSNGMNRCMTGLPNRPNVPDLVSKTNNLASAGKIDPLSNLATTKVYIFHGINDGTVKQGLGDDLRSFLLNYTSASNIIYNNTTAAEHAWITWKSGTGINNCGTKAEPYLNNCSIDPEQTFLQQFYGTLNAKNSGTLSGQFLQVDQSEFLDDKDAAKHSLDSNAWLYVPSECASNKPCKIHVAIHGCQQYNAKIGDKFVKLNGLNEWADTNRLIVLYPQTINAQSTQRKTSETYSGTNPNGCWDFWGYDSEDYHTKTGKQMLMIKRMVDRITSGWSPNSANPAPTSLAVGTVTYNSAALTWSASTGATGYNVYRSATSGGARTKINTSPITGTSTTATGLDANSTYYFVVKATDSGGLETVDSNQVQTTTPNAPAGSKAAPTGLSVGTATENSLTVSWGAVSGAAGYNVYMSTSATGTRTKMNTSKVTGTSYAVTGLSPSSTYYFVVRTLDGSDLLSAESAQVSGATTAPAYCKQYSSNNYQHVQAGRATSCGGNACAVGSGDNLGLNNVANTTTLTEKPQGYYKKDGSCQELPLTPPTAVTTGAVTSSSVALSWTAGGGTTLAGYNVYYSDTEQTGYRAANTSLVSGTAYTVTGLSSNRKYFFQVKSANSAGQESTTASNTASATTSTAALAAPTVTVGTVTQTTIDLSWGAVSGASGYNVYWGDVSNAVNQTKANASLITGTTFQLSQLAGGKTYYITVRAQDAGGVEGAKSTEATVTTQTTAAPAAPTSLALGSGKTDTMIPLTWTASSGPNLSGYNVYRASQSGGPYTKLNGGGVAGGTSYNDNGLTPSTTYYYVVRAVNTSEQESANSNELSTATNAPAGPAPASNLSAAANGTTEKSVALTWTASNGPNLAGYNLYVSNQSGVLGQKNNASLITGTSYTATSLNADTTYYFTVKAQNSGGVESTASNQFSVKTLKATYCKIWTDTNLNHVAANPKRATTDNTNVFAVGSGQNIGLYNTTTTSLRENPQGYFQLGNQCGTQITVSSVAADDGYVKSTACGTTGNSVGTLSTPSIGKGSDAACNRTFLSFDTSAIPDGATVTRAYVQVTYSSAVGDPWASPAGNTLQVDVKNGLFNAAATEASDYNATPTASGVATIGKFTSGTKNSSDFNAAGLAAINKTGKTQVRLRFQSTQTASNNYVIITEGTGAKLIVEYIDPNQ